MRLLLRHVSAPASSVMLSCHVPTAVCSYACVCWCLFCHLFAAVCQGFSTCEGMQPLLYEQALPSFAETILTSHVILPKLLEKPTKCLGSCRSSAHNCTEHSCTVQHNLALGWTQDRDVKERSHRLLDNLAAYQSSCRS